MDSGGPRPLILLVEDDPGIFALLGESLSARGCDVRGARSLREARQAIDERRPGLVLLDYSLPDGLGLDLVRELASAPAGMPPFVVMTGAGGEEVAVAMMKAGAIDYLVKDALFLDRVPHVALSSLAKIEQDERLRQAEARLRETTRELEQERSRLASVVAAIPSGFTIQDRDYRILFQNDFLKAIFGDSIGKKCHEVYEGNGETCLGCPVELAFSDGRSHESERTVVLPSGKPSVWRNIAFPVRDADGGISTVLEVATDVTEAIARKKQEAEEKGALQEQLFRAQKLEAIGTLAGGIAHDFNNLLAGIQANAAVLAIDLDLPEESEERGCLSDIERLVARGAELTRQLLGFARKGSYLARPIDLNVTLVQTARTFGRTRKDLAIRMSCAESLPAVLADRPQIEQAFLNLLINAGQAMPNGGVLALRTEVVELAGPDVAPHDSSPGRYVRVSVSDEGVGMDEATRSRIFEPFFTTKQAAGGTGLGLASVYGIVKIHRGFVTIESEVGHGTTFTISLPATTEALVAEAAAVRTVRGGSGVILLVDDEDHVRMATGRLLRALGYRVIPAVGGREAVDVLRRGEEPVSLVLLDLIMPGMGGAETLDAMRAIRPDIKIIVVSGYSLEGQAADLVAKGNVAFLQKPYPLDGLSRALDGMLGATAGGESWGAKPPA